MLELLRLDICPEIAPVWKSEISLFSEEAATWVELSSSDVPEAASEFVVETLVERFDIEPFPDFSAK